MVCASMLNDLPGVLQIGDSFDTRGEGIQPVDKWLCEGSDNARIHTTAQPYANFNPLWE